ncbi:putative glycosyl hydrolase [Aspergillus lucknowensis]|uniref:Glycoside hydrolase superfamily n=1 Tax=Aspergillus lucknowensis TaxID=176173 RepID=A0ABR4LXK0_9EURO
MWPSSWTSVFLLPLAEALQSPGDRATIAGWHLQSTQAVNSNLTAWSLPHANVSSWYRVGPRATVLAGLIQSGVYNESDLFYSDHLADLRESDFQVPWLYREEFALPALPPNQHLFLITHGISSKADIFFNGIQIASSDFQRGSYVGVSYDLTPHVFVGSNAVLIKAYPTNYHEDLALGWVDWNPHPPDSGMGVWRAVELQLTGPVSISSPRITTNFSSSETGESTAVIIKFKADVKNHGEFSTDVVIMGAILSPDLSRRIDLAQHVQLPPYSNSTVSLKTTLNDAQIWWPAAWGPQPLYQLSLNVSLLSGAISDIAPSARFGIRNVASTLNANNDVEYTINGHRFQVRGAGYAPDIFLRFDIERVEYIFQYVLDMGLNTIRLEGKQEHPAFFELADRMGLMVMAGWECCDKWEAWTYNEEAPGAQWHDEDYIAAYESMVHEAEMMQLHPSLLAFLVGSDYWPDERATQFYLSALHRMDWPNPIIASASKRGHPSQLPESGMKMDGPYDWVPPNYWYGKLFGAAFGFGSEQGAGVGTPELPSLQSFLSPSDLKTLWSNLNGGQYHLSPEGSDFHDRKIYNTALSRRYGSPQSLEDYIYKAQIMDYEATRAEFEAFAARQNASHQATGVIYWMLNSAWPSLHWQLLPYDLRPAGAYFGTKVASRLEHVVHDYESRSVYLINHSLESSGTRRILVDLVGVNGTQLLRREATAETVPLASKKVLSLLEIPTLLSGNIAFLRLVLTDDLNTILSRNIYWVSTQNDILDWDRSNWYTTPVTTYANFTALGQMQVVKLEATAAPINNALVNLTSIEVTLENQADVPAFFIRLAVVDPSTREELTPVFWSDNYVTLFPRERLNLTVNVRATEGWMVTMRVAHGEEQVIGRG